MIQDHWDSRFINLAKGIAGWSKDEKQTGCVIVRDRHVLSMGYNGFPAGILDEWLDKEEKNAKTIHAEINAVVNAKRDLLGSTVYVYPHLPCSQCAAVLVQARIKRVVTIAICKDKWRPDLTLSMFKEANITLYIADYNDLS